MSNEQKYIDVFTSIFNVKCDILYSGFTFKDVEAWDSLTHLTLIDELENTFNVIFESNDIIHFGSFANGMNILKKYGICFRE